MASLESGNEVSLATVRILKLSAALRSHIPGIGDGLDNSAIPPLLALERGDCRISQLAELTHSDVSVVSRQVALFEKKGLAHKRRCAEDGRAYEVQLSAEGRELVTTIRAKRAAWVARLLDDWADRDIDDLVRLMNRLGDAFERELSGVTEPANPAVTK